jgi:regulator of replication initiation timing
MEEHLHSELNSLERKLKILLRDYFSLKEENLYLRGENENLKSIIKSRDEQLNNFQNKIKISKIVDVIADEGKVLHNSELKTVINEYIKEIDKCIAHLSE